jgi:hypothetical protein
MLQFEQFLRHTAERGGSINTLFEEHLFALVGTLERIARPLSGEKIPYELIGGGAVMVHVNRVDPSAVRLTKDLDIMVRRADLDRITALAPEQGFPFGGTVVRLIFTGEKVKPNQTVPNPPLRPEHLSVHDVEVAVIPVADLIVMKLSNHRDIDRVHVRDLDSVGLVTAEVENALPPVLRFRLQEIRGNE